MHVFGKGKSDRLEGGRAGGDGGVRQMGDKPHRVQPVEQAVAAVGAVVGEDDDVGHADGAVPGQPFQDEGAFVLHAGHDQRARVGQGPRARPVPRMGRGCGRGGGAAFEQPHGAVCVTLGRVQALAGQRGDHPRLPLGAVDPGVQFHHHGAHARKVRPVEQAEFAPFDVADDDGGAKVGDETGQGEARHIGLAHEGPGTWFHRRGPEVGPDVEGQVGAGFGGHDAAPQIDGRDTVQAVGFADDRDEVGVRLDRRDAFHACGLGGDRGQNPQPRAQFQNAVAGAQDGAQRRRLAALVASAAQGAFDAGRDDRGHEGHPDALAVDHLVIGQADTIRHRAGQGSRCFGAVRQAALRPSAGACRQATAPAPRAG